MKREFRKSTKLEGVGYDIRGPILEFASKMEEAGEKILKLNIGNPALFGFRAPEDVIKSVESNLTNAEGYVDSKGIFSARVAVADYSRKSGIKSAETGNVYIGNGVSELISICTQALLNDGDELMIPSPDYPLWTAAVTLAGGRPVHYICDEASNWLPDISDIERKISRKTRGIVVINPNNPTGAVYPKEVLQKIVDIAAAHNLIIFADEIYDRILYDDLQHISIASLSDDVLFFTLNGLSKSHMIAGFRVAWLVISGKREGAGDLLEGVNMLASMRLCSNVPAQFAIEPALKSYDLMREHTGPFGRLTEQRNYSFERINSIPGISCVKPNGAFYLFPKIDSKRFSINSDEKFVLDFLLKEKVLLVQGTGFNWHKPDHFRIVFLPEKRDLELAFDRLERFLSGYKQF
ncbi:MAG: pyridoxal phosphate-dependent aminotransferase [Candidatus Kryptoniota bacterium]